MSTSFMHPSQSFQSLTDRILDDLIENRFGGLRESIAAETSTREAGPEAVAPFASAVPRSRALTRGYATAQALGSSA